MYHPVNVVVRILGRVWLVNVMKIISLPFRDIPHLEDTKDARGFIHRLSTSTIHI